MTRRKKIVGNILLIAYAILCITIAIWLIHNYAQRSYEKAGKVWDKKKPIKQ